MAELVSSVKGKFDKYGDIFRYKCTYCCDSNGMNFEVYTNSPCSSSYGTAPGGGSSNSSVSVNGKDRFNIPGTSSRRERVSRRRRPSPRRMRFKNFEGESSGGYKLFTQQYFIGIGVGVLLGYYLLPKLLKK